MWKSCLFQTLLSFILNSVTLLGIHYVVQLLSVIIFFHLIFQCFISIVHKCFNIFHNYQYQVTVLKSMKSNYNPTSWSLILILWILESCRSCKIIQTIYKIEYSAFLMTNVLTINKSKISIIKGSSLQYRSIFLSMHLK